MATTTPSTAPTVREMINTHTLATNIITRYGTENDIFDGTELAHLHRFVANPSSRDQIMRDINMADHGDDEPGMRAANEYQSLAGFIIARHGTEYAVMTDGEIEELRQWFEAERRY